MDMTTASTPTSNKAKGQSPKSPPLIDRFGRHVNYVRISVTDRCDFRCVYCMSEDMEFVPRSQILTLEEIAFITRAFTELGVTKVRITGGEPLVRRNIIWLLEQISQLEGLEQCVLTTNGSQLSKYAKQLHQAGVKRMNISLDTLDADRFKKMSRVGDLQKVLQGIATAIQCGFQRIRINAVILKNYNHDEVADLLAFAINNSLDIAFIEEMPMGIIGEHNRAVTYYSSDDIKQDLQQHYELLNEPEYTGGPARYYQVAGTSTRVGFISPHSHNFCDQCNRVRLTPEGRLLLCLGQEHSVDLRQVVRDNPGNMAILKETIIDSMSIKPLGHEFDLTTRPVILRHMNVTGG
ncbi:GTP 3',8-cyclase MoaA [Kaarinaea lacus]